MLYIAIVVVCILCATSTKSPSSLVISVVATTLKQDRSIFVAVVDRHSWQENDYKGVAYNSFQGHQQQRTVSHQDVIMF